jgi:hypothetical protein
MDTNEAYRILPPMQFLPIAEEPKQVSLSGPHSFEKGSLRTLPRSDPHYAMFTRYA